MILRARGSLDSALDLIAHQEYLKEPVEISARSGSDWGELQRLLLEEEGVAFDSDGRVSLERYRWRRKITGA